MRLAETVPEASRQRREQAADVAVRLTLSHMLLPGPGYDDAATRVAGATCAVLGVPGASTDGTPTT